MSESAAGTYNIAFNKTHREALSAKLDANAINVEHSKLFYSDLQLARSRSAFIKNKTLDNLDKYLIEFESNFTMNTEENDSLVIVKSKDERVQFFFKLNPDRKILHTQQVELNGFIHSILSGTKKDSKGYRYYGARAYGQFIK